MSYDGAYFRARERWRDWRIEARELIRLGRVEPGARVLEIGCGGGGLLRMVSARGARGVGVDTLEAALRLARKNLDADGRGSTRMSGENPRPFAGIRVPLFRISDDNNLPFTSSAFDAILGQHVVEHIAGADAALREWHRLLKPGGYLALATPNARYPDPAHFADANHTHIFSSAELTAALERAGFQVENCITVFPYFTRLRFLRGIGIIGYNLFRRAPYWSTRGRTLLISALKS